MLVFMENKMKKTVIKLSLVDEKFCSQNVAPSAPDWKNLHRL